LTEELVFRGAILYILISKIGSSRTILLSAILFGVYHWFSFGVIGNLMAMLFVFIGTGLMGYAWALAFSKTNSIFLPFGLHLRMELHFKFYFLKKTVG
jgi:membrane protease YdiL (CAAX protease family)